MNERPDTEQIKAQLAREIIRLLGEQKLTDAAASEHLGIPALDVGRIRDGDLSAFSIDRLVSILNGLDQRVTISVVPAPKVASDTRPIWERIADIVASIPPEELEKLPTDLAVNHDHYLYGSSKRE